MLLARSDQRVVRTRFPHGGCGLAPTTVVSVLSFLSGLMQYGGCTGRTNVGLVVNGFSQPCTATAARAAPHKRPPAPAAANPICSDFIIISSCNGITRRERRATTQQQRGRQGAVCTAGSGSLSVRPCRRRHLCHSSSPKPPSPSLSPFLSHGISHRQSGKPGSFSDVAGATGCQCHRPRPPLLLMAPAAAVAPPWQ